MKGSGGRGMKILDQQNQASLLLKRSQFAIPVGTSAVVKLKEPAEREMTCSEEVMITKQ